MLNLICRSTASMAAVLASLTLISLVSPAVASAIECGAGTVYDPPSDTCIAAPLPPPPPPPPPAFNGDLTPYFSEGICAPIPFVSVCTGI
jgi:hypothetical protein